MSLLARNKGFVQKPEALFNIVSPFHTCFKELVKNCLKGLVPDSFKGYFNIRRCDIHSHNTKFNKNLFIDKIKLEISKCAFYYKGAVIFNS